MDSQLTMYRSYVRDVDYLLQICGLWPLGKRARQWPISLLIGITGTFISICIVHFCIRYSNNIPILTSALSSAVSFWTMIVKIVCYLSNHKTLRSLHESLRDEFMRNLKNRELRPYLLMRISTFSKFLYAMAGGNGFLALTFTFITLKRIFVGNQYILLYPAIYPIPFEPGKSLYWGLLIFEIIICFYLSFVTAAVDVAFGYYAFHLCGELSALGVQFRQLQPGENYNAELKKCVKTHQLIIKNKNKLLEVYAVIVVWVGITGALVLCSLVFQTSQIKEMTIQKFIKLVAYMYAKIMQIFSFAWFGTLLTTESEATLNEVYKCGWTNLTNKEVKNDILIVMTQKPMTLKIKEFFTISLNMFIAVMNATVSYFFLLRTLDENKTDTEKDK